ncbi:momilactone A synthase-like [Zingiber officinale]|uniref:Uncharacterized protein n=1 Tax=Zingiber officinale TaxID=94328 RepID=A0A8J5L0V6_ZINOF|nr:momilactone A synthase-like [Zingiber officinale]KAG6500442.1 hypothetical protein ZIOFF_040287 [Zingiber officinale]
MASSFLLSSVAKRLEGKVALITGGASGLGECTAKLFARLGARVVVADIQDHKGRVLCDSLGPDTASYVHCDVTKESDVASAVDAAVARHGKLDVMFSNAGVAEPWQKSFPDCEVDDFQRLMSVNVTGVFLTTKHAARVMSPAGRGSIVITGSAASTTAGLVPHAYTCSKHAVVGLMRSAAAELGKHGIRVNCVSPHGVATPLAMASFDLDKEAFEATIERSANLKGVRLGAEDVAEAVAYLAGDESRYVSGVNLLLDGGFTIAKGLA